MKIVLDLVLNRKNGKQKSGNAKHNIVKGSAQSRNQHSKFKSLCPRSFKRGEPVSPQKPVFNGVRNNDEPNLFILFICNISIG